MIEGFISRRLSGKLLLMTIGFVMLAELVIFIQSADTFREDWLSDLADHITYIHMNNNYGDLDMHLGIDDGVIDYETILIATLSLH